MFAETIFQLPQPPGISTSTHHASRGFAKGNSIKLKFGKTAPQLPPSCGRGAWCAHRGHGQSPTGKPRGARGVHVKGLRLFPLGTIKPTESIFHAKNAALLRPLPDHNRSDGSDQAIQHAISAEIWWCMSCGDHKRPKQQRMLILARGRHDSV